MTTKPIEPSILMTTSSFLAALRANASLPLVFSHGGTAIPSGYHLTEVKDVTYRTMDCGGMTHLWSETQFELWTPSGSSDADSRGHMAADKFLGIVERVEKEVQLGADADARVFARFATHPPALYAIESVSAGEYGLTVHLSADRTRCKASERREKVNGEATGSCCGTASPTGATMACCG